VEVAESGGEGACPGLARRPPRACRSRPRVRAPRYLVGFAGNSRVATIRTGAKSASIKVPSLHTAIVAADHLATIPTGTTSGMELWGATANP
jgi:hypothetical protein